jgi:uncharacterized membrane protein
MRWLNALLILCAASMFATPAAAALHLCNRTSYILYAATGTASSAVVTTQGWVRLAPGSCHTAIASDLGPDTFVYARTSPAHNGPSHEWGGTLSLCARKSDFKLETPAGANHCTAADAHMMPFKRLEANGSKDWTTTFTQSPPLASAAAARRAGFARLLADLGYRLKGDEPADLKPALQNFRLRMNIIPGSGPAAVFDALETHAMKVTSPAGYSVCNDTSESLWAALGYTSAKGWSSHGWWQITAGTCAQLLAHPLDTRKIYLLAERKNDTRIVTGKTDFCVADITFDVEKRSGCKARGLTSAGFALTDTHGRSGFTVHISEDGILPLAPRMQPAYSSSPK